MGAAVPGDAAAAWLSWELVDRQGGGTVPSVLWWDCSLCVLWWDCSLSVLLLDCSLHAVLGLFSLCAFLQDKRRRYSMMHSQESGSSVFFHSQEEGAGLESWNHSRDSEGSCPTKRSPDRLGVGRDPGGESDTDTGQVFLSTCPCLSNQTSVPAPPIILPDFYMSSAAKSWRSLQER